MLLEPLARHSERRINGAFHCERAIRTTIGRELHSYYDLSEPIPDRMLELLKQIDDDEAQITLIDDVHADGGARRDPAWAA
jgi:hypothetical protein